MNVYDTAHTLARQIQQSDEYKAYHALKERVNEDQTNRTLLSEYQRLQVAMQLRMAAGGEQDSEDMQRFTQLSSLLMLHEDTSRYLLAEMQLQRLLADLMKILSDATGIHYDLPGTGP